MDLQAGDGRQQIESGGFLERRGPLAHGIQTGVDRRSGAGKGNCVAARARGENDMSPVKGEANALDTGLVATFVTEQIDRQQAVIR